MAEKKEKTTFLGLVKAGGFIILLLTIVLGIVLYRRTHKELRQFFIDNLTARVSGIQVELDKVQLLETQGVRLHGLRFYQKRDLLLNVEEAQIDCDITLSKLLNGEIKPEKISFRYPTLYLQGIQTLNQLKQEIRFNLNEDESKNSCPIELHNGSIVFRGKPEVFSETVKSLSRNGTLTASGSFQKGATEESAKRSSVNSDGTQSLENFRNKSRAIYAYSGIDAVFLPPVITKDHKEEDSWSFKIHVMNPYVKTCEIDGVFSPVTSVWKINGSVTEQEISDNQLSILNVPEEIYHFLKDFRSHSSFTFNAQSDSIAPSGYRFEINGEIFRGNATVYPFRSVAFARSGGLKQKTQESRSTDSGELDQGKGRDSSVHAVTESAVQSSVLLSEGDDFDPQRLSWQLTDLYVQFHVTDKELKIDRATGRSGAMTFLSDYYQESLTNSQNALLRLQINDLYLKSSDLRDLIWHLPESCQSVISKFEFAGTGKLKLVLKNELGKWLPKEAVLTAEQADAYWEPFAYPLEDLVGEIKLDEKETLSFLFKTCNDNKEIQIQGKFDSLLHLPKGKVNIQARSIPIDGKLIKLIPTNWRQEIVNLNPNGYADIVIDLDKPCNPPDQPFQPIRKKISVNVYDGSIKNNRFPYPVTGITGHILCENDNWTIKDFKGTNRSAVVRADGFIIPDSDQMKESNNHNLSLQLKFENFPLGEELQNALVCFPQKDLIRDLRLQGKADAQARISFQSATKDFDLEFEARPIPNTTSIKPDIFPYELRDLDGLVVYRRGELVIDNLRARNGQSLHQAGIHCLFNPDGSWVIDVKSFLGDQLMFNHELQSAVPIAVLSFIHELKLSGFFNLNGSFRLSHGVGNAPLIVAWDSNLTVQQNTANFKIPIKNICGAIKLRGLYVEDMPVRIHGELDIDSLSVNDVQTTRLTGPFYYDGKNVFFGQTVPFPLELDLYLDPFLRERLMNDPIFQQISPPQKQQSPGFVRGQTPQQEEILSQGQSLPLDSARISKESSQRYRIASAISPEQHRLQKRSNAVDHRIKTAATELPGRRSLSGVILGGPAVLNGWLSLEDHYKYQLDLVVQDALLQDALRDLGHITQEAKGRVSLNAAFQGEANSSASLKGDGQILIHDAALYKMPFILKVMTGLSVNKEEEQKTFDSSRIDFHAIGHKVSLDNVVLGGKALTLFGNGWLVLEENERYVDLRMNSRFGNVDSQIPVISEVIGSAGDQLAQIRIEGPLSEPTIWTERFPGIKKAWWGIFPDKDPSPDIDIEQSKPFRPFLNGLKKL